MSYKEKIIIGVVSKLNKKTKLGWSDDADYYEDGQVDIWSDDITNVGLNLTFSVDDYYIGKFDLYEDDYIDCEIDFNQGDMNTIIAKIEDLKLKFPNLSFDEPKFKVKTIVV